jgi:hypothetical protein
MSAVEIANASDCVGVNPALRIRSLRHSTTESNSSVLARSGRDDLSGCSTAQSPESQGFGLLATLLARDHVIRVYLVVYIEVHLARAIARLASDARSGSPLRQPRGLERNRTDGVRAEIGRPQSVLEIAVGARRGAWLVELRVGCGLAMVCDLARELLCSLALGAPSLPPSSLCVDATST